MELSQVKNTKEIQKIKARIAELQEEQHKLMQQAMVMYFSAIYRQL